MTDITLYLHFWQPRIEDLPVTEASVENAELELGGPRAFPVMVCVAWTAELELGGPTGIQISSVPGPFSRCRRTVTAELRCLERVSSFR
jgi:hypothetical protein